MAQFTNRATLTYGNVTRESNVTVGEIISSFAINKKSVFGVYERGSRITSAASTPEQRERRLT